MLDIFRTMANCPSYFPFQGTQCFEKDADDLSHHLQLCCAGQKTAPDTAVAHLCLRQVKPLIGKIVLKLKPVFDGCVKDPGKCTALHNDYFMCKLDGGGAACGRALTNQGLDTMQLFRELLGAAKAMYKGHEREQTQQAKTLLRMCSATAPKAHCARHIIELIGGRDDRLGDAHTDRR